MCSAVKKESPSPAETGKETVTVQGEDRGRTRPKCALDLLFNTKGGFSTVHPLAEVRMSCYIQKVVVEQLTGG